MGEVTKPHNQTCNSAAEFENPRKLPADAKAESTIGRQSVTAFHCALALLLTIWVMVAQAGTLSITDISVANGNPKLTIQSETGITNQTQRITELSLTNWLVLTNLVCHPESLRVCRPEWFEGVDQVLQSCWRNINDRRSRSSRLAKYTSAQ